jgi:hypothetical protein
MHTAGTSPSSGLFPVDCSWLKRLCSLDEYERDFCRASQPGVPQTPFPGLSQASGDIGARPLLHFALRKGIPDVWRAGDEVVVMVKSRSIASSSVRCRLTDTRPTEDQMACPGLHSITGGSSLHVGAPYDPPRCDTCYPAVKLMSMRWGWMDVVREAPKEDCGVCLVLSCRLGNLAHVACCERRSGRRAFVLRKSIESCST